MSRKKIPQEIWKAIPEFPGYEVSDQGRVRSFWERAGRNIWHRISDKSKVLKFYPTVSRGKIIGVRVALYKVGRKYQRTVADLVLSAFIGTRPVGKEVCHCLNNNPLDNRLVNLRWDTHKSNCADKKKHGSYKIGIKHFGSKLSNKQVLCIRELLKKGKSLSIIAKKFLISRTNVHAIGTGRIWGHLK